MVIVAVRMEDMLRCGGVPMELNHLLLPNHWHAITDSILKVHTDANFWTMVRKDLQLKLSELNTALFNGLPVISESDGNILFNTAYLSNIETVYLDRTNASIEYLNSSGVKGPGHYQDQSNYVAISNPVVGQVAMRTMLVKVPPNAGPGSVITVTAPTGNILSVVVPPNTRAGSDLAIQY